MNEIGHYCSACGQAHGGGSRESDDLKIARLNAERDIQIARLARGEVKLEAEAAVEAAEVTAEAGIEQTAIVAETVAETGELPEPGPEPEPAPVVVVPPAETGGDEVAGPPEVSLPATEKKGGSGWWDGYR
ncbi:MAG TPA: hypothetical protein VMV92_00620 [Streptosporangiaceae bacterium]|nr:hypothetical protein [Streptosporangiaceae bacterium]